jgi:hypothetical protein
MPIGSDAQAASGGAGPRPDYALAALPSLRRRPVCVRAGAWPARAWTTGIHHGLRDTR